MSIEAVVAALAAPVDDPRAKLVLIALANHAGADGTCYPGAATLGEAAVCHERTARRKLDDLEAAGWLTRTRRRRDDGTLSTYRYRLTPQLYELLRTRDHRTAVSAGAPGEPPDTAVPADPPDTAVPALNRQKTFEPSGTTTTADPTTTSSMPVRPTGGATLASSIAAWAAARGEHERRPAVDRTDAYRQLIALTQRHLDPGPQLERVTGQLILEYLEAVTGDDADRTVRRHVARLVAQQGPATALRLLAEAVAWGAGLDADDPKRDGLRGVVRYAVAVSNRERADHGARR